MDPYLEPFWRDIHARLVIYACDQLQTHLPGDLRARVEERVLVENPLEEDRPVYPDVRVVERGRGRTSTATAVLEDIAEPIIVHGKGEPMTETFIEIIDVGSGKRVVTVIEFLSPSNKTPGDGQEQYRRKQKELQDGHVSLVEIDLLRSGQHALAVPRSRLPKRARTPYKACVRRGWKSDTWEVYPLPLRSRLHTIKIPLRETDADVPLKLQALIEQCYKNGGYDEDLDYREPLDPPLDPNDAAWADELLRTKTEKTL
jgi:hypothetical protein